MMSKKKNVISIFHKDEPKKFWQTYEGAKSKAKFCQLIGSLSKFSKKQNKLVKFEFQLVDNDFFYENNIGRRKYRKIHFDILKIYPNKDGQPPAFSLSNSYTEKKFICTTREDLRKWFLHLKNLCIHIGFDIDFELKENIGEGSSAAVYKVKSNINSNTYAAKIFNKNKIENHSILQIDNIRTEIEILRNLDHVNIPKFYQLYEDNQNIYLIMELHHGGALFDFIVNNRKYKEEEAKALFKDLLITLLYLESKKIIHRDIKLQNIMLKSTSNHIEIKIIDFGLALSLDNYNTKTPHYICGTPGYIAPEIFSSATYTSKVDIFSSGVVLYTFGRMPFRGDTVENVLAQNALCQLEFSQKRWDNISKEARDLVTKMMEKDPIRRISASEALKHEWLKEILMPEFKDLPNLIFKSFVINPKKMKMLMPPVEKLDSNKILEHALTQESKSTIYSSKVVVNPKFSNSSLMLFISPVLFKGLDKLEILNPMQSENFESEGDEHTAPSPRSLKIKTKSHLH